MPLKPWKKLGEHTVVENPWWVYKKDDCRLPSGKMGEYHYVHSQGSALVIPMMSDGRILMVNQYRYLCQKESIEFPCGSVRQGSSHEETARSELREETGYAGDPLSLIAEFNPYNGVTDEMCRVYLARALRYVGGTPDETEEFELMRFLPQEVDSLVVNGTIWDGMSIAAWFVAKNMISQLNWSAQ